MLHWIYIVIAAVVMGLVLAEMFREKQWRNQLALATIVIPLILRILHIK
jgi:hypothetical protein